MCTLEIVSQSAIKFNCKLVAFPIPTLLESCIHQCSNLPPKVLPSDFLEIIHYFLSSNRKKPLVTFLFHHLRHIIQISYRAVPTILGLIKRYDTRTHQFQISMWKSASSDFTAAASTPTILIPLWLCVVLPSKDPFPMESISLLIFLLNSRALLRRPYLSLLILTKIVAPHFCHKWNTYGKIMGITWP